MAYSLGARSLAELEGVHPSLVAVVKKAITLTKQDFSVHDGLRTITEQREYVRRGVSKTMNSMHMKQPDGLGHAVDLVPWINSSLRWEMKPCLVIAAAVHQAARELGVPLIYGAIWDRSFLDLPEDAAGIEKAVNAYVTRRRGIGKSAFLDFPHYQLA